VLELDNLANLTILLEGHAIFKITCSQHNFYSFSRRLN
jgi:hypothetical protein